MPLKIALVGCGQIAEAHLQEIQKIPDAEIVAVCDFYEYLLRATAERFGIPHYFFDYERMLDEAQPDVVHITTPPSPHYLLAEQALKRGIHAYIEKPMTLTLQETEALIDLAESQKAKVCAGHNWLFDPRYLQFKSDFQDGLFGEIRHIEAYYGYSLDSPFGKLINANPKHWVTQLPGQLFQNIISHPVSVIVPFLSDDSTIQAFSADWGECKTIHDELRVLIHDDRTTAYLTFTSNIQPMQQFVRYYGEKQSITIDFIHRITLREAPISLPGPFARLAYVFRQSRSLFRQAVHNTRAYFNGSEQFFTSLRNTIQAFYQSILKNQEPPIPYQELRKTTAFMERIFQQINSKA